MYGLMAETDQTAPAFARASGGWMSREEAIMGTAIRVELWHDDRALGEVAMAAVMEEMHRIDRAMSPFKPESELSRVNREAARGPVPISAELYGLIERSLAFSRLSGGAFDITFAGVGRLFDYRAGVQPSEQELAAALPAVSYRHLLLDAAARTIAFARAGVQIDLGGIAKGHAVDNCVALLKEQGVRHALVMAGGDSRVLGDKRGRPWMVGIRHPRAEGMAAVVPLVDAAISTSGDYERYFEAEGVRHHHIIDPETGRSARGVFGVSVIGPDATTTEGLGKTVFVLGVERGLGIVESMAGVDAVVIDSAGRLHYSSGLLKPAG
jgi:thiamine biosynthesis lipoprotein